MENLHAKLNPKVLYCAWKKSYAFSNFPQPDRLLNKNSELFSNENNYLWALPLD